MADASYLSTTRTSYDTAAADYAKLIRHALDTLPLDRAMLNAFAELVRASGGGPVADIGCGPGHVTAYLHSLGLTGAFGVDLSPGMIKVARADHPRLRFEVGSMTALDLPAGSLRGAIAWYSIIHIPSDDLLDVFVEFGRVLAPGGWLLLGFKAGHQVRHLDHGYGHPLNLDVYHRSPEYVSELLSLAGFVPYSTTVTEAEGDEQSGQAFMLVRRR